MLECNTVKTSMEKGLQLKSNTDVTRSIDKPYREMLRSIMYIMLNSRLDLCYPVGYMGRYQQNPSLEHWKSLNRIVRYLNGTKANELSLYRHPEKPHIIGFANADWGSYINDRKLVRVVLFFRSLGIQFNGMVK